MEKKFSAGCRACKLYGFRFLLAVSFLFCSQEGLSQSLENEIRIIRHVDVTMSDGVKLYADVYLPKLPGKYPTIVTRTCYGVQRDGMHETVIKFAQRGYAVVVQDVRGRYESEGVWQPFRDEGKDGYETIEWAAAQPFSNGKVATQGGSYLGHNQWAAASTGNAISGGHISGSRLYEHLCQLDYHGWRISPQLQLWMGGSPHAEPDYAATVLA